jgi:YD repeat-containing protein
MTQLVSNGVTSTLTYDLLGRKTALNDPDQGNWTYQYNAFGDMTQQTDALGAKTVMTFDTLGRMATRQDIKANNAQESNTTWTYGTSAEARNVGQLMKELDSKSYYSKVYAYDALGRPSQTVTSLGQAGIEGNYAEYVTYDQFGRVFQQIDATAKGVQHVYNAHGYQEKLVEASNTSKVYHTITQANSRGQVTGEALMGTQFQVARNYNLQTGLATSILATSAQYVVAPSGSTLLDINLTFDEVGNLANERNGTVTFYALKKEMGQSLFMVLP